MISNIKPSYVTIEKFFSSTNFVMMYQVKEKSYRVIIVYRKSLDNFEII